LNSGPLGLADAGLLIARGTEGQFATTFYNTPENEFIFGYTTSNDTTGQVVLAQDSFTGQLYADVRLYSLNVHGDINMTAGTATLSDAEITDSTIANFYLIDGDIENVAIDVTTIGTGIFTGSMELVGTTISDASSTGILVLSGGLGIDNTTNSVSGTNGGALTVAGGAAIAGKMFVNSREITPSLGDIIAEGTFTQSSPGAGAQNVTDLNFENSTVRAFNAMVVVKATTDAGDTYAQYEIKGLQKATGTWVMNESFIGDNTDIEFAITSAGQVTYEYTGINTLSQVDINFKAMTTSI
jgi:hypothetical protein